MIHLQYKTDGLEVKSETRGVEVNTSIQVGVILDLKSPLGAMAEICISMAVSDFYDGHSDYQTRLVLNTRDAHDSVGMASSVVDLLKNEQAHAIIGPQWSAEAKFAIELGEMAHVPMVSFSATSPSLSPTQNTYFIRTAQNDASQIRAIVAVLKQFGWPQVVLIHEDTEYGTEIVPYLFDSWRENDIGLAYKSKISSSAMDFEISRELNKLRALQTKVFLVHMTSSLGSRLFSLVDKAGMMSIGYSWLITDGISNSLEDMDPAVIHSMEGVLGVKPHVPETHVVKTFKKRWQRNLHLLKPNSSVGELNIFGFWAYDTVWALATAAERIVPVNPTFLKVGTNGSVMDLANLSISKIGPRFLSEILNTKFKGLGGDFHLVDGQLQPSVFEIFNVIGRGQRIVGFWTPKEGISQALSSTERVASSGLKNIIWPGDSTEVPTGWAIPMLRIGVPVKTGFTQFVKIDKNGADEIRCTGFSIEVFEAALKKLAFNVSYVYVPFMNDEGKSNGSYNDLLHQIEHKIVDAVVGDTTIIADRTSYVDFTLPYTESRIVMVVPIKHEKSLWSFLQPLGWDLWFTIIGSCIFFGLVIRIMERHHTANTRFGGPPSRQLGMIFWFPFSSLVFPQRELLLNDYSIFVLVMWLFLAFILMQSYTASLSSILTVDQLHPTFFSVQNLKTKGYNVGYQNGSFVLDFLKNRLKFDESKLKAYDTIQDYDKALSEGSEHDGVAAIFDEIPFIRLFLDKYGSNYMITGPTYRTDGFGFAFPRGSPLVPYISRAILKVREDTIMDNIEKKYFKHQVTSLYSAAPISADSRSLSLHSFGGLFIITGIATLLALVISEGYFWEKPVSMAKKYGQRYLSSRASNIETKLVAHSTTVMNAITHSLDEIQINSGDSSGVSDLSDGSVHQEKE
ncbi:hypothetical protein SCA6_007301 [Theobroma cacao]